MSFFSPRDPDSRLHFPKPVMFRDSLLSPAHFCTPNCQHLQNFPSGITSRTPRTASAATSELLVTIRPRKPSYINVGYSCLQVLRTRRSGPWRRSANVLSGTDAFAQPWYMTGANEWANSTPWTSPSAAPPAQRWLRCLPKAIGGSGFSYLALLLLAAGITTAHEVPARPPTPPRPEQPARAREVPAQAAWLCRWSLPPPNAATCPFTSMALSPSPPSIPSPSAYASMASSSASRSRKVSSSTKESFSRESIRVPSRSSSPKIRRSAETLR